jgi:hypothetical protein
VDTTANDPYDQSQAPLDGLRFVLQRVYDCTARLIDLVMSVASEPSGNQPAHVERWWSAISVSDDSSADHQSLRHEHIRVVDLRMCWIPAKRNEQLGRIVIQRVIFYGPGEASYAPDEDHSKEHDLQEAIDDYVAKKLVDPTWKRSTQVWVTPVCENMASAAEKLSGIHDQYHNLVLGEPVQSIGELLRPDSGSVDVAAGIVEELPLPGDTIFKGAKRLLQYAGILIGAASGHPLLVNACVKSLLKDYLVDAVRDVIGNAANTIGDTLNQVGGRELSPIAAKPTDPRVNTPTPRPPDLPPGKRDVGKPNIGSPPRPDATRKRQTIKHSSLLFKAQQADRRPWSSDRYPQLYEPDTGGAAILSPGLDDASEPDAFFAPDWDEPTRRLTGRELRGPGIW